MYNMYIIVYTYIILYIYTHTDCHPHSLFCMVYLAMLVLFPFYESLIFMIFFEVWWVSCQRWDETAQGTTGEGVMIRLGVSWKKMRWKPMLISNLFWGWLGGFWASGALSCRWITPWVSISQIWSFRFAKVLHGWVYAGIWTWISF